LLYIVGVTVIDDELDMLLASPLVLPSVAHKRTRLSSLTCGDSG